MTKGTKLVFRKSVVPCTRNNCIFLFSWVLVNAKLISLEEARRVDGLVRDV